MELWGWGKKNTMDVNSKGQGLVAAMSFGEDHKAAIDGDAYTLDIDAVGVNGAEHLCVIKNGHSSKKIVVTSVLLWVATYKDTTFLECLLNETFTYAAGGTVVTPANMRSGKIGGAEGEFYAIAAPGTDITTFSGTSVFGGRCIFTTTPYEWRKESGWIIPPGQVWSLYNNGNDNTYSGYVSFYYHD